MDIQTHTKTDRNTHTSTRTMLFCQCNSNSIFKIQSEIQDYYVPVSTAMVRNRIGTCNPSIHFRAPAHKTHCSQKQNERRSLPFPLPLFLSLLLPGAHTLPGNSSPLLPLHEHQKRLKPNFLSRPQVGITSDMAGRSRIRRANVGIVIFQRQQNPV